MTTVQLALGNLVTAYVEAVVLERENDLDKSLSEKQAEAKEYSFLGREGRAQAKRRAEYFKGVDWGLMVARQLVGDQLRELGLSEDSLFEIRCGR